MMNKVSALMPNQLSDESKLFLQKEVTEAEIKATMFSLGNEKAPGPDGFTAYFFKKSWSIIGRDVCHAVKSFFQSGSLLKEVNSTIITLVPKVQNPSKVAEFRPITKILANRFRSCLNDLVSPNQTAFIKGRSISENILLAQELVKGYHKDKGKARCAIKVDLKKAYDSVEWSFTLMCLLAVGYPPQYIHWVSECITNLRFSIALNGSLVGNFKGGKGLRQGDLLSLYLFVLAMEVFSKLLSAKVRESQQFKFHSKCEGQQITHLSFADDLLILVAADIQSITLIRDALDEFKELSGLSINQSKSEVFCAVVSSSLKSQILSILNFKARSLPVRYLGMPLITGGLGLKRVEDWNKAVVMKHIWNLFTQAGSLWVAWVYGELLKGKSLCTVKIPQECSWGWMKLLKSRIEARKLISYEVGDGNNKFLWHDKWHPNGVLLEEYGHRIIYDATSTFNAKVSSVLRNKEWVWRPARSENLVEIQSKLSQIQIMDYDRPIWSTSASGNFSCAATWEHFRTKGEEVNWWKLIWFKEAIPKHGCIG
uniref:Reverse transcriptase domain-containing protein n=1 Tax=Fagus sylvatica TaxID=28930 RepID=A0A2N9HE77_FAGSY